MTYYECWYFHGWEDAQYGHAPILPPFSPERDYYRLGFYDRLEFVRSKTIDEKSFQRSYE